MAKGMVFSFPFLPLLLLLIHVWTASQGEQSTWAKLSAIKSNCGIEVCLDKCLRELEHQGRLAREDEAKRRREAGQAPSRVAEEGAAATGETEGEWL